MKKQYDTDVTFAQKIRLLCALSFVPEENVINVFDELVDSNLIPVEAQSIVNYFEDVWIGRPDRRNKRKEPYFKISMWNCHHSVETDLPKTNNKIEGWHNSFSSLLNCSHPVIWKFIECLKMEQARNELLIEKYISGESGPPQKKKVRKTEDLLKLLVSGYIVNDDFDNLKYLKSVAYNFNL